MENNILKLILKAIGITLLVVITSYYLIGKLLVYAFGNPTVEVSYHLPTYTLLIGLIFTVIFCTLLILDKLNNR